MAKRTTTARTKKDTAPAASVDNVATQNVSAEGAAPEKLHSNEQNATSIAGENQTTFEFRFWELGELKGKVQGVEVGHDGAPVDLFVFDEANFQPSKPVNSTNTLVASALPLPAICFKFRLTAHGIWPCVLSMQMTIMKWLTA